MKRAYMKPIMRVEAMEMSCIICGSKDWDVIGPGAPNTPPGARRRCEWNDGDCFDDGDGDQGFAW